MAAMMKTVHQMANTAHMSGETEGRQTRTQGTGEPSGMTAPQVPLLCSMTSDAGSLNGHTSESRRQALRALNDLRFPILRDCDYTAHHLTQIERLMSMAEVMESEQLDPLVESALMVKVVASIEHGMVKDAAEEIIRVQGDNWMRLKEGLNNRFGRKDILRLSLQRRLQQLEFPPLAEYERYLSHCSSILGLVRQIYGNTRSEVRPLIREFVGRLPEGLRLSVVKELHSLARSGMSWEETLPFDENSGGVDGNTISAVIRQTCLAHIETQSFVVTSHQTPGWGNKGNQDQRLIPGRGTLPRTPQGPSLSRPPVTQQQTSSLPNTRDALYSDRLADKEWAKNFPLTVVVRGAICQDPHKMAEIVEKLETAKLRTTTAANGAQFGLLGFKDNETNHLERVRELAPTAVVDVFNPEWTRFSKNRL